ncbi:MAG: alkaline phosphatase [Sphingomonadaceae bacterium]
MKSPALKMVSLFALCSAGGVSSALAADQAPVSARPISAPIAAVPVKAPATEQARAKNVILFIGDGMGISTITAARIYDGQTRGETGEENLLSFEHFPNVALVKTYNTNQQVPDSAGTATALNSGVKTRAGMINIGPAAHLGNCSEAQANILPTAAEKLVTQGLSIGIVSTARITHATPAAVYGHSPDRNWESDSDIPDAERAKGCTGLADQLLKFPFSVALGGGSAQFYGSGNSTGGSVDGGQQVATNLARIWAEQTGNHYVNTSADMKALPQDGRPVLGLFSRSHMTFMLDRTEDTTEPTLSEMTATAIDRLQTDPDGYFLMVEGGRIDHGHHAGKAGYALSETQELSNAVQTALNKVDLTDTLILVTADHSHVFTIAGYPTRGNSILGLSIGNDEHGDPKTTPTLATDGKPYTTLGYQNGPGAFNGERPVPETGPKAMQQALVPTGSVFDAKVSLSETHGGEDVALYAAGPQSGRAHGVIEQNIVYSIIMDALNPVPQPSGQAD